MLHQVLSRQSAGCAIAPTADLALATRILTDHDATEPDPVIRRLDGSIDFDHYDRIAREMRARELAPALKTLTAPANWLLGVSQLRSLTRMRTSHGS